MRCSSRLHSTGEIIPQFKFLERCEPDKRGFTQTLCHLPDSAFIPAPVNQNETIYTGIWDDSEMGMTGPIASVIERRSWFERTRCGKASALRPTVECFSHPLLGRISTRP
jgi:hypothetical protein